MSREFATERALLKGVEMRNQTTRPSAGAGTVGAIGSYWLRNGSYPATPNEIYLKLAAANTAWTKQNVVNIKIQNVKAFGALGDGATDDTPAINAAIAAAVALGGGCIYFPATPNSYRVTKTGLQSILLSNVHDLVFLGDGFASTIAAIFNAALGDYRIFMLRNGTKRIKFINLRFLGSGITNPDPANQAHFIQVSGVGGDAFGGASDVDIVGCWFGQIVGAGVRNLAESGEEVNNVRILYNAFDPTGCRSNVEAQRYSRKIQVKGNWMTGTATGNVIDFEPTGGSGLGTAGPEEWAIVGNLIDHGTQNTDAITIGGAGSLDPARRCLLGWNIINNGGGIQGGDLLNTVICGNIVQDSNIGLVGICDFQRLMDFTTIWGNVLIATNNTGSRPGIRFFNSAGINPSNIAIHENMISVMNSSGTGLAAVDLQSVNQAIVTGNLIMVDSTVNIVTQGIQFRAVARDTDNVLATGNLIIGTTNPMAQGVKFSASPNNMGNSAANYNFVDNAFSGIRWERAAAQVFTGWRQADGNNLVGMTTAAVDVPATNVGVTGPGVAGPGEQIVMTGLAAGPGGLVPAPVGSLAVDFGGTNSGILWVKESGAGVGGGTAGWIRVGDSQIVFAAQDMTTATAARFLATGMGLVAASTVEIKLPMPRAGILRNFRIQCVAGVGASNITYTVRKNGVNQTTTATIANTATTGSDLSHVITVAAGDLISVQVTKSAIPTSGQTFVVITIDLEG